MGWIAIVLVAAVAGHAAASPTREAMTDYFAGEKRSALIIGTMGAAGLIAGGVLFADGAGWARGASYPLLAIGAIHAAIGVSVYISSPRRVSQFTRDITGDEAGFITRERDRIHGVERTFSILLILESVVLAGGIVLFVIGHSTDRPGFAGAGITLAGEMLASLAFDTVASRRAERYRAKLGVQPGAGGEPRAM